jgi:hypothetical protein
MVVEPAGGALTELIGMQAETSLGIKGKRQERHPTQFPPVKDRQGQFVSFDNVFLAWNSLEMQLAASGGRNHRVALRKML